jgi:hypothetical protein
MDPRVDYLRTKKASRRALLWQRMLTAADPVWASMQSAWAQLRMQFRK